MNLHCIIIEDEPYAQKLLENYIQRTSFLVLRGIFTNPMEALPFLSENKVDVIFLDIEMPELNGMDFMESLENEANVIFTTAFSHYAVESYEKGAVDYLLKPINFNRFLKAVNRLQTLKIRKTELEETTTKDSIYIKTDRRYINLKYSDLYYVEGLKDYVIFRTETQKYVVHNNLKKLESLLPTQFMRVHYSYIINFEKVKELKDKHLHLLDAKIPVSKKYHESLMQRIQGKLL
jgi:two-component system LytT family response regulator